MSNWSEVRSFLHNNYQVSEDNGQVVKVLIPVGPNRSQFVFVGPAVGVPVLLISSIIGPFAQIDPLTLLQISSDRFLGVQAGPGGYIVMSMIPLGWLDADELTFLVDLVGSEADAYERQLGLGDAQ